MLVHDNNWITCKIGNTSYFLQKKVATCNNKLSKLQNSLDKLATDADREWSLEFLTKELEQLDNQYELSYKGFKTWLIEYDKSKTREIDLKAKFKEDRKARHPLKVLHTMKMSFMTYQAMMKQRKRMLMIQRELIGYYMAH